MARPGRLSWHDTVVDGRRVHYATGGPRSGVPVLFLHGWSLGCRSYKEPLERLLRSGCRVWAPALPGFGGSGSLPSATHHLTGYGEWANRFLDAVGVAEPALVAGHSMGGAVATALTAAAPDRVGRLVLLNSVGSGVWSDGPGTSRRLAERPLWDWAAAFAIDLASPPGLVRTVRAVADDCLPNLVSNPLGLLRGASMARRAEQAGELRQIRQSGVPVTVVTSESDPVVPRASFEALCRALGVTGTVVAGGHSWLLADPDAFGRLMTGVVSHAGATRRASGAVERPASEVAAGRCG